MQKKIFSLWSILLVLVVSLSVLGSGCPPVDGGGTIEVEATLCGVPWEGDVDYTLTPATGSPINGTNVSATHSVAAGNWTCSHDGGGPAGAFLDNIAPSATQEVSDGATITFTLEFELNQDAWIDCLGWTKSGFPYLDDYMYMEPCDWLDVHFMQGVLGCDGYQVAVNETSWLQITQTGGPPGPPVQIFVVNDSCAVNKTPEPIQKVSQNTSFEGEFVNPGDGPFPLFPQTPVNLDVETIWTLVKEVDYEKAINWFGVSVGIPEPGHPCVLFELVMPGPGVYQFTLQASAEVALMDDVDVNPQNDSVICPQIIYLTVTVP